MVDGVVGLQTVLGGVELAAEGARVDPAAAQVTRLHVVLHPAPPAHNLLTDEAAPVVRVPRVHQFHVLAHVFKQTKSYAFSSLDFIENLGLRYQTENINTVGVNYTSVPPCDTRSCGSVCCSWWSSSCRRACRRGAARWQNAGSPRDPGRGICA